MRNGEIERVIGRYKFHGRHHWATIFARVLVGFLEDESELFKQFDLIVASPTYVGPEARFDHTRRVIELAHVESRGEWPFDVGAASKAIIKTADTPKMKEQKSWKMRDEIARNNLRNALTVPDPRRTKGKAILVYDDVFTDGHTLNEVARCLKLKGQAREVCGVTLARQPWGRR
jgi:predicted amidophosphoribosyltransferase